MKEDKSLPLLTGDVLDDSVWLSFGELARICSLDAECLIAMVDEGVLEPRGMELQAWRFHPASITRVQVVLRLRRDLGVNLAGAALVLDLLDEIEGLQARLRHLNIED